ncbi:TerD family protein [Solibacillus sp. FSL H8-0538]|uniref:TerD family protein n=1 Tax=Solibacillus sp. FSL H8-0538 TaxID=2921400 RepID=UPI0030FCFB86
MSINLQKGQRIDLTKGNAGLNKIIVGLGWDPVQQKSGGLLGGLLGSKTPIDIDCDASVIMLQNDRLQDKTDVVYFGNLKGANDSVTHSGDNRTGDGDGDDETIYIELNAVPQNYNKLIFVVNIYDCVRRKQHFGMLQNAYIRIVNPATKEELLKYNLSDNYSDQTTLITGEIYRHDNEWKFAAVGTGTQDASISDICKRY